MHRRPCEIALSLAVYVGTNATGCSDGFLNDVRWIHVTPFDSTFVVEPVDFDDDGQRPVEGPGPEQVLDGLLYRAVAVPEDTTSATGPMQLRVHVELRNPTSDTARVPVLGCPVWLEVFAAPARVAPPVWTPGAESPETQCVQEPSVIVIPPQEMARRSFLAHDTWLASGLADGRYYVTAVLRRGPSEVRLDAGSVDVWFRLVGAEVEVRVDQIGMDSLAASVRLTNRQPDSLRVLFGACAVGLTLYQDPARSHPVPVVPLNRICPSYLRVAMVGSGSVLTAQELELVRWIEELGRGMGPGRYFVEVTARLNWRTTVFPAGVVELY